ncbi:MAG: glycosyltransferase family 1 protein [Chloroflexi bacterium CFX4]|nr:glycosyltransferase family 1 protein [Chloroflexi bacterium CFX4]MDL1922061.1 glycosyltransferase family 4 protein [Chloroflexi bacterium CFX3]
MHIALLATDPSEPHGWSNHARDLIGALAAHGTQITLITAQNAAPDPNLPNTAVRRILPSLTTPPRALNLRLLAANLAMRHAARNADLVHVLAEPYTLAALALRQPLLVTAHGTYLPQTAKLPRFGALYRRAYRRAQIICVSSYTERRVRAALPQAHTQVIPNGVDTTRFAQPIMVQVAKRAPTVLAVGQVKPRKGFLEIVEAMARVRQIIPDAEAVFIGSTSGDPRYVASLHERIAALGLSDAVRLLGRLPDAELLAWYAAADVFALHSRNQGDKFEGFGLVYLEASAAGLPVIGTTDCGAEDAIQQGKTGFLVAQGDSAGLADAIVRLLRDPELRAQLGVAGKAFAAQHTWEAAARQVLTLYQQVLMAPLNR